MRTPNLYVLFLDNQNVGVFYTLVSIPLKQYKKRALAPLKGTRAQSKEGGDLLSHIALQYHRRGRA